MNKDKVLAEICQKYNIRLAYLFGSQVEKGLRILQGEKVGVSDLLTDLDVGVVTCDPLPLPAQRSKLYADLAIDLGDLFEPFPLDLVFLEENHSVFQAEALKGRCIYASAEGAKDSYELNVLRRAADFRPFLEMFLQEALEG